MVAVATAQGPAGPAGPTSPQLGSSSYAPTSGAYDNGQNPGYGVLAPTAPGTQPNLVTPQTAAAPQLVPLPDGTMGTPQQLSQYNTELAAIQGPKNAPGVDMSSYISAFNTSYNQQMASIQAGLTQSLGELQGRRNEAAGIVAKLPQMVNSDYAQVLAAGPQGSPVAGLSSAAQAAAAPDVALDRSVGKSNVAAAKGDQQYEQLGINANTQSGEAALNASANSAEAGAAAQRDSAQQALMLQQAGYQDQYQLARQTAGNQFTESQIAAGSAPSGIPGLTVSQYNAIQGDPAFASQSQTLASMMTQPKAYTATAYQSILNSLTPQQRLVIQATNPGALTMNQSLFASANSLAGGTPSNQKGLDAVAGNYFGPTNPYYGNVGGSDSWDPFSIAGRLTAGIG